MVKYRVIKPIRKGRKTLIKIGAILTVYKDYERIGGVETLLKGNLYICDVGSRMANECCVKMVED
jgi:hypothetical protein